MLPVSFRWFVNSCLPAGKRRKQAVLALTLLVCAGCGGGAAPKGSVVKGPGFTFVAPAQSTVSRKGSQVSAAQGTWLICVAGFPLLWRFWHALWAEVVPELDGSRA